MSTSEFTFIPRKLSKHTRASNNPFASRLPAQRKEIQVEQTPSKSVSGSKQKEGKYLDDKAYTVLLELALSDYALWSNAELFEAMEANEDGFVPISYLIQTSLTFAGLASLPPEATLIRCARASNMLEGRLIVSENPHSDWRRQARTTESETQGGFEVRRKDWGNVKSRICKLTSYHWDSRTIYAENLPFRARSFCSVHDFVRELSPCGSEKPELDVSQVQSVSFPAHQKDRPDAPPPTVGKGFAFIVLSHVKDVDYLLQRWPWNLDDRPDDHAGGESPKAMQEAFELGFRCMSKNKWDELKEDYLSLQSRLLAKTLASNVPGPSTTKPPQPNMSLGLGRRMPEDKSVSFDDNRNRHTQEDEVPAWFPASCLVFVKNVHPETNKTTLRGLFAAAFEKDSSPIDYVDYTKGLDSCYLRLSGPQHARTLASYFSEHKIIQSSPLDNIGAPAWEGPSLEVELVQGKREEMYWEKVPEKIRKAAIAETQGRPSGEEPVQERNGKDDGDRKRKRRKRG